MDSPRAIPSIFEMDIRWALTASRWEYAWFFSAVLGLAIAWSLFVSTGSQTSYVVALVAASIVAASLAIARSSLLAGYILALVALVGPDANGTLGAGNPPLGSLRLVDAATLTGALPAIALAVRSSRKSLARLRRPGALAVLSFVAASYAALRWSMEGDRTDSLVRADVRLLALALLLWLIAVTCRRGGTATILWAFVAVGLLAAIKAAAIHLSGVYGIGSFDRLQASNYYVSGHLRTILDGGDTVMILAPAVAVLLLNATHRTALKVLLGACVLGCLWALGLSATRTSVLVALGLVVSAALAVAILARPPLSGRVIGATAVIAIVLVAVALLGGAASRLTHADAPHVGLNFRKDEIKSFLRSSASTKYLGQGLGGRFMGKDINGRPVVAGWAHELPVWIALKAGVLGLICAVLALCVLARRVVRRLHAARDQVQTLSGAMIVAGLVIASLTLDRLALVEGLIPLIIGVFLISSPEEPHVLVGR